MEHLVPPASGPSGAGVGEGGSSRGCLVWKISGVMECVGEVGGVWQLEAQTEIRFELRCAVLNILGSSMHGGGVGVGV